MPFEIEYMPTKASSRYHDDEEGNDEDTDFADEPPTFSRKRNIGCGTGFLLGFILTVIAVALIVHSGKLSHTSPSDASVSSTTNDDVLGKCQDPFQNLKATASLTGAKHAAVAADHPLCSRMGLAIMRDHGGNAIDASVTTALCQGVASPASSGIGGGAFILIHTHDNTKPNAKELPPYIDARDPNSHTRTADGMITEVIDCREKAPKDSDRDMFLNADESDASTFGGLAVAIPGELKGLELAHARYGKLKWEQVLQPVVDLARSGVPVSPYLEKEIEGMSDVFAKKASLLDQKSPWLKSLRKIVTKDDNWREPLGEGDLLNNPALADTLEKAMKMGAHKLFDSKDFSEALARDIQNAGGVISSEEFGSYRPTIRSPILVDAGNGFHIAGVPPPSSGGAAIVGIVRFLAYLTTPLASYAETLSKHWFVEACRNAFSMRMSLCDPAFNNDTVIDAVNDLTKGDYMKHLLENSSPDSVLALDQYGGSKWAQVSDKDVTKDAEDANEGDRRLVRRFGYLNDHGTSHFSVVDSEGNAVAMTTSVNTIYGSRLLSESTGILLNNVMDDFSTPGEANHFGLAPSESNFIHPGKAPLSSMSPTMVFRTKLQDPETMPDVPAVGELVLAIGASGGPKIITAVAQVLLNFVVLGMPLFDAMIHPRLHDQLIYHGDAVTLVEESYLDKDSISVSSKTRDALSKRDHKLLETSYTGAVQAVAVDLESESLDAVCDVRKGGSPDGY